MSNHPDSQSCGCWPSRGQVCVVHQQHRTMSKPDPSEATSRARALLVAFERNTPQAEITLALRALLARIETLETALRLARTALPDSTNGGPDGTGYRYVWDECTSDEQEWVKEVAEQIAAALAGEEVKFARFKVTCTKGCVDPKRDPDQEHPGICVCGGHLIDEEVKREG